MALEFFWRTDFLIFFTWSFLNGLENKPVLTLSLIRYQKIIRQKAWLKQHSKALKSFSPIVHCQIFHTSLRSNSISMQESLFCVIALPSCWDFFTPKSFFGAWIHLVHEFKSKYYLTNLKANMTYTITSHSNLFTIQNKWNYLIATNNLAFGMVCYLCCSLRPWCH